MNINSSNYLNKYLKYKKKYLDLKTEYMNEGGDSVSETKQILKSLGKFKIKELTDSEFSDEEKTEIKDIFEENFKLFISEKNALTANNISYVSKGTLPQTFKATAEYEEKDNKLNQETNYVKFLNKDHSVIYYYDLQSEFIHTLKSLKEVNDENIQDYQLSSGNGTGDNGYYLQSIEKVKGNFNDFNSKQKNLSRVTKIIDNIKAKKTKESK